MTVRTRRDGRKLNTDPLRKVVDIVHVPMLDMAGNPLMCMGEVMHQRKEQLECGHIVRIAQDIYGETNATRRRCRYCRELNK